MNRFSPIRLRRAKAAEPQPASAPRGSVTGVALDDVRALTRPLTRDPFDQLRPPLDQDALRLSAELANMTYSLELDDWVRAGWSDVSIQIDNHLESGVTVAESQSGAQMADTLNARKLARARYALREPNPIAKIFSALRQREGSDTIKAVTMLHPAGEGRYVVAIGFMGTGSRFYDWFSNLRFTTLEGFHKGFYQLSAHFEQRAERIFFPETARELGLDSLTLAQILEEMKSPDSRFTLWMAGHSQGGAVMQVFCHKLLTEWGVQPRHIVGYGFASPTVATARLARDPSAYPLYHVVNTDDVVPRMGAAMHLGVCLQYQANEPFRAAAYGWGDDPEEAAMREDARALTVTMNDTLSIMETLLAFLELIMEEKGEDGLNALMDRWWSIAPIDRALSFAGVKAQEGLKRLAGYTQVAYYSIVGRRMDPASVALHKERLRPFVQKYPLRKLLLAVKNVCYPPHSIMREHSARVGAYGYIARRGLTLLRPFVWVKGETPEKRYADAAVWAASLPAKAEAAVVRAPRRCAPRLPARQPARRRAMSARRVRSAAGPKKGRSIK